MGYRLYAKLRGAGGDYCFGKLFGYRTEREDASSNALRYLYKNSSLREDYFEDEGEQTEGEILSEIASMFESDFKFRIKVTKAEFLSFIMLYAIEAAERWRREGEEPERCLELMKVHMTHAVSLVSQESDYGEVILTWG